MTFAQESDRIFAPATRFSPPAAREFAHPSTTQENRSSGYAPCGDHEAGQQWANLVGDVQNWLVARGYDARVVAHAADDIETGEPGGGWSCAGQARAFVDGFASNNWAGRALLDFGDAVTSSNCWSIQDVLSWLPSPSGLNS